MTGPRMSGGRFDPHELDELGLPDADLAADLGTARAIDAATFDDPAPSAGFAERVMAAIAEEPDPMPVAAVVRAARGGTLAGVGAALGGAWRTVFGPGFPVAARVRAGGVLLAAALGLALVGGVVAAGASRLLTPSPSPSPIVSPAPSPSQEPSQSPSPTPSATHEPDGSPGPSAEPTDSAEPTESAEPTDTASPTGTHETSTPNPTRTPRPSETPEATDTQEPTQTPDGTATTEPSDDGSSGPGSSGSSGGEG